MNFYKLKINDNSFEIINLNLIRNVNYSENEIISTNAKILVQITYIDGSYSSYFLSYSELCRFENALHPSIS